VTDDALFPAEEVALTDEALFPAEEVVGMTDVQTLTTRAELATYRASLTGRVGTVMTMGALHQGHTSLLRAARGEVDHLVATIFVNPLQFGPNEDADRYPRTLEQDLRILSTEGVDAVFMPTVEQMYPSGAPRVRVDPGPLASILEGAHRPGHFDGVLTVVLKLLNLTRADVAYFGEKDYQQLTLIRGMVADLNVPVDIVAGPTVRQSDGLALSSRNRFLSPAGRESALALSRGLAAGADAARAGLAAEVVVAATRKEIDGTPELAPDYVELTDPSLGPAPQRGSARLLVAAKVGGIRLIDNRAVEIA
jgi:pantoate--beta-alanine ligase